jgi:hypothetical protein
VPDEPEDAKPSQDAEPEQAAAQPEPAKEKPGAKPGDKKKSTWNLSRRFEGDISYRHVNPKGDVDFFPRATADDAADLLSKLEENPEEGVKIIRRPTPGDDEEEEGERWGKGGSME